MRPLAVFLTLRTVMAAVLESFLVHDRYLYLQHAQALQRFDLSLLPLFREELSPRNMVLVAQRRPGA